MKYFDKYQMLDALEMIRGNEANLWTTMTWSKTPQGYEFWYNESQNMEKYGELSQEGKDALVGLIFTQVSHVPYFV